jgi:aminoglycoside 2'-N-acetyltransferase I
VRLLTTANASDDLLQAIRRLLDDAFDGDFSDDDWEHTLGGWHAVVEEDGTVVAHAAVVPRVLDVAGRPLQSGYVEGVGTAPARRGEGLGSLAMAGLTQLVRDRFELGALSTDRHGFYGRLGWERWQGPTFVRRGDEVIRTDDEDDGIMVLRAGPSRDVALTAPITCEGRRGDDW